MYQRYVPVVALSVLLGSCGSRGGSGGDDDDASGCASADDAAIQCREDGGVVVGSFSSYCGTDWDEAGTDWICLISLWEDFDCSIPQGDPQWSAHTAEQEDCRATGDDDDSTMVP